MTTNSCRSLTVMWVDNQIKIHYLYLNTVACFWGVKGNTFKNLTIYKCLCSSLALHQTSVRLTLLSKVLCPTVNWTYGLGSLLLFLPDCGRIRENGIRCRLGDAQCTMHNGRFCSTQLLSNTGKLEIKQTTVTGSAGQRKSIPERFDKQGCRQRGYQGNCQALSPLQSNFRAASWALTAKSIIQHCLQINNSPLRHQLRSITMEKCVKLLLIMCLLVWMCWNWPPISFMQKNHTVQP